MNVQRLARSTTCVASSLFMCVISSATAQQPYPSKPIRFIVPYPPGGGSDPMARMAAQKLGERWGQVIVVDNRPGGNTIIGTEAAAKSPRDGYTILLATPPFVTGPSLLPYLPYDTVKDFDAVATIAKARYALHVHPSLPAGNVQALIALAKARPGQLNYASAGVGAVGHLAAELFAMMAAVKMQHIPYKGGGPLMTDLLGGQVHLAFQNPIAAIPHINSGRLKALAITGETRLPVLPQVPTFSESGFPAFDVRGWYGIVVPAGTPRAVIDKMSAEMTSILGTPDVQDYLRKQGLEPYISTPSEFAEAMKAEMGQWSKVIKSANIRLEN